MTASKRWLRLLSLAGALSASGHVGSALDKECAADSASCGADDTVNLLQHALAASRQGHVEGSAPRRHLAEVSRHRHGHGLGRLSLANVGQRASPPADWPKAVPGSQPILKDVYGAFMDLNSEGRLIKTWVGSAIPRDAYSKGYPPYSEHFQGIQRQQDDHYLYLSGSGKTAGASQIFTIELDSRSKVGAMGSNMRNAKGEELNAPPEGDRVLGATDFDAKYWHAGGFTVFGKHLAVGAEAACEPAERVLGSCKTRSKVHFFDVSEPGSPKELPYVIEREDISAGAVALTQEVDGRFLLMVGRTDSAILDFYRSTSTSMDTDPQFTLFATWNKEALLVMAGVSDDYNSYQNMNFVRQLDGTIFLIGTTRTSSGLGKDLADIFMLDNRDPKSIDIQKVGSQHLSCSPHTCNMYAGGGVYVDSDSLVLYASDWEPLSGQIYINEFRGSSVGIGRKRERLTGGTCHFYSGCSDSRGPTDCVDNQCICKDGFYTTGDGKCIPE